MGDHPRPLLVILLLCLAPFLGTGPARAAEPVRFHLWLLDVGPAPLAARALFSEPDGAGELPDLLRQGLLLSAGYLLLPMDRLEALARQVGEHLLTRETTRGGRAGVQEGSITALGSLVTYPGRPARLSIRRSLGTSPEARASAALGPPAFPAPSALVFQVTPEGVTPEGRVVTRVRLEAQHQGRSFRYEGVVALDGTPVPIAGLLVRESQELIVGPFTIPRDVRPRLAALAVSVEPPPEGEERPESAGTQEPAGPAPPPTAPAPDPPSGAGRLVPAASLAPFVTRAVDWFGPLPVSPEPSPAGDAWRLSLAHTQGSSSLILEGSWRWSEHARIAGRLQDPSAPGRSWVALCATLSRRLEVVGLAAPGPDAPLWYAGVAETTRPWPSVELSAAYLVRVDRSTLRAILSSRPFAAADPAWSAGAVWRLRPWRAAVSLVRPPDDVEQVRLQAARLLAGAAGHGLAAALEGGLTYRWSRQEMEWHLGLRWEAWE